MESDVVDTNAGNEHEPDANDRGEGYGKQVSPEALRAKDHHQYGNGDACDGGRI